MSDLVNGEILDTAREKIGVVLKQKRLKNTERVMFEILDLLVLFMSEDHPKTRVMWSVYGPVKWVWVIAGSTFIGALITGRLIISISP